MLITLYFICKQDDDAVLFTIHNFKICLCAAYAGFLLDGCLSKMEKRSSRNNLNFALLIGTNIEPSEQCHVITF